MRQGRYRRAAHLSHRPCVGCDDQRAEVRAQRSRGASSTPPPLLHGLHPCRPPVHPSPAHHPRRPPTHHPSTRPPTPPSTHPPAQPLRRPSRRTTPRPTWTTVTRARSARWARASRSFGCSPRTRNGCRSRQRAAWLSLPRTSGVERWRLEPEARASFQVGRAPTRSQASPPSPSLALGPILTRAPSLSRCQKDLVKARAIDPLILLGTYGNDVAKAYAVAALDLLRLNNAQAYKHIVDKGGMQMLEGLKQYGIGSCRNHARDGCQRGATSRLAEAGRSSGQPEACSGAERGL